MQQGFGSAKGSHNLCDLTTLPVLTKPFPHVINNQFINPEHYGELRESFPVCPPSTGPTGFSLYWGDAEYQKLLDEHPAWQSLFNTFHSQQFIDWAKEQFGSWWKPAGCKIDLSEARYVPYREDRIDKELATLRRIEYDPHELWVRMDIHQGRVGYSRPIHLDHRRRLISLLVYLCDHKETQMEGGELFLHTAAQAELDTESPIRITPEHNLMVAFPCMARSYHSVSPITSMSAPRNYLQVHISSSVDIWEPETNLEEQTHEPNQRPSSGTHKSFPGLSNDLRRLDLEASRAKLLEPLQDATDITVIRNYGNMGDQLIHAGMRKLLEGVSYREVELLKLDGVTGDLAVITGSGAWCGAHRHMPEYLPRIENQFRRVIIFPTTFDTSIPTVLNGLTRTNAFVFAREFGSYDQIRSLCNSEIAHDTAFFFDFRPYYREGRGTLIAFRTDGEALTGEVPPGNNDISMTCESLDEFLWTIARHDTIETDRAHVMIAAALLGKKVRYGRSNYHKVPALALSSLQDYPVVSLADNPPTFRQRIMEQARANENELPEDFAQTHSECQITVVMLSCERFEETRRAIGALQQHVRIPFKLIVFDNGSSADTQSQLKKVCAADARIELILSPQNLGCVGGRVAAIERVETEYLLLLDNDVEVLPGAVEHLLFQIEQEPQAVATTGKVVFPDGSTHVCGANFRMEPGVIDFELLAAGRRFDEPIGESGSCDWVPGCLSLFRTQVFRHHRYDLGFRHYFEDFEWGYRVSQAGEGRFYRNIRALGIHYHESKFPSGSLPTEEHRRQIMPYVEMLALFYERHGLVNPVIFSFIPQLKGKGEAYQIQCARLLFELINTHGNEWVLDEWNNGALTHLLEDDEPYKGSEEITALRTEVEGLRTENEQLRTEQERRRAELDELRTELEQRRVEGEQLRTELDGLSALYHESQRAMNDIVNSKSFKITSMYARLRRRK
ncbi:MAG TPA: glycosyltransferase [Pyrinomonadaceae bacterium]|nr:glycosyltransferase [Pyrinomonadaceae bacterium]